MARRRSARHARPTGRGALAAAHVALEADVARLRSTGYADQLELVRLSAIVDALVGQVQRLSLELAELRRELQVARTSPAQPDPAVEVLAAQVADLRATVAAQQTMLSDLTRRLIDLMARIEGPVVVPVPPPAPPTPTAPPAFPVAAAPAAHVDLAEPPPVASARATPTAFDDALDDETVQRLRLIRESYGR
jgi:uncharacterized coiled-coil protein SlyX